MRVSARVGGFCEDSFKISTEFLKTDVSFTLFVCHLCEHTLMALSLKTVKIKSNGNRFSVYSHV